MKPRIICVCSVVSLRVPRVTSRRLSARCHFILPLVFLLASSQDPLTRKSGTFSGFTKQFHSYPSSTCSFTSLDVTAAEATTEHKPALQAHSLCQSEFVQDNWDSASRNECNRCLLMKTGLRQMWKDRSGKVLPRRWNLSQGLKEMKEHASAQILKQGHVACLQTSWVTSVAEAEWGRGE